MNDKIPDVKASGALPSLYVYNFSRLSYRADISALRRVDIASLPKGGADVFDM